MKRHQQELVPRGDTVLQPGDVIVLLCDEGESHSAHAALESQCKN